MDMIKIILASISGALFGLYLIGENVFLSIGAPLDVQASVAVICFLVSLGIHILFGGRVWPFSR